MGDIFVATDDVLGREVVLKVLSDRYAADEGIRARFKREGLAAARLSGEPGAVTIFDVGEWQERPFIVMEYLPGGSLEQRLREEGAQPPGRALAWLGQAAATLDAAHAHGVVHRDVKPANLLLDERGELHVADFGIASAAGLDSMTLTGTVLGTAGYLAPEQAAGGRSTAASDLYSLAVVAYELLSGHRPFERESPTAEAAAHVNAPVPSIAERCKHLPYEVDAVFQRALAKDPRKRYGSAREFVADLRHALHEGAGTTARFAAAPPPQRRQPGLRLLLPAALLLLAAGIGAALAFLLSSGGGKTAQRVITRTVAGPGGTTTVRQTVTQQTTAPAAPPPPPPPPARSRWQRARAQRPGLLADAARQLRRSAAVPAAGGSGAPWRGPFRPVRGLRQLQPRLHPLPARAVPGSRAVPAARPAARAGPRRAPRRAWARRTLLSAA